MLVSRTPSSILSCQNLCPIFVFNPHFKQTSSSQSLLVTAPHPFHNANLSFALPRAAPNDGSRGKLGHAEVEEEEEEDGFSSSGTFGGREVDEEEEDVEEEQEEEEEEEEEFSSYGRFRRREDDKDYDRDPEFAEILGSCFEDPQKAQARVEARIRKKRNKILHAKAGSSTPMKVSFNKFNFSNSYIWFEFYNAPLPKDISLICDTIRSWHIIGRLGGLNSMNMQLSQSSLDKRPSYDAIQGANVTPTTFYNIGNFEVQDNLARIWIDIGTSEPLLLDVLINTLTQISSDFVGIKQLVFGGLEFENWKEGLSSEDAGFSVHKI